MSYIRPLSNPEKLYIYASGNGVNICLPHGRPTYLMDPAEFEGLLHEWNNDPNGTVMFGEAYLEKRDVGNDFKWFLGHNSWDGEVEMWEVTLEHIAEGY